jgi:uncharacterized membrane protein
MGLTGNAYKLLVLLHLIAVVAGIGTVSLNALYGAQSRQRKGPGGLAITEANDYVSHVATFFIYAIPLTGIAAVLASDKAWSFGQTWIWLSLVLYVVALGLSHGVLVPTVRKMIAAMKEMEAGPPPSGGPPPQVAELERLGGVMARVGPVMSLLSIALIALMVFKPGI